MKVKIEFHTAHAAELIEYLLARRRDAEKNVVSEFELPWEARGDARNTIHGVLTNLVTEIRRQLLNPGDV